MGLSGYNFTEHVRRALAQARNEAAALRHEYVGTEHELLGILAYDDCIGCVVLENLGIERELAAERIRSSIKPGRPSQITGPDLPYTSRAKKVLELAMSEARDLQHTYVGTEHLLLGLLREEKGIAAQVLNSFGVTLEDARDEVLSVLDQEKPPRQRQSPPVGEKPTSVGLTLHYRNGVVVKRQFRTVPEATSFLNRQDDV